MNRKLQICVIGNSLSTESQYLMSYQIGQLIAEIGAVAVTGGGGGVMEAVLKGAFEFGGTTIGILKGNKFSEANQYCSSVIPSGLGHTRNSLNVLAADIVIGIGGGSGTLSEYCFAWIEDKPTICFVGYGGWTDELAGKKLDDRDKPSLISVNSLESLKIELNNIANKLGFTLK